jgi:predicted TIM-barrel fold metal-dependent hydrolase
LKPVGIACYNLLVIIDFHTHVLPPQIKKNRSQYIERDPCFAILYSKSDSKIATTEELIASMDEAGVDISVILNYGWTTHELCRETNDYIMESVSRFPQRLVGFCAVQLQSPEAAIAEIERYARAGIRGVGEMRPDMQLFDLTDEMVMAPLVEALRKNKLILLTHASEPVGHDYPGKGSITPDILYPFIAGFPDLKLVCAHWGGGLPFYALMPEVGKAMSNVFFDTAASPLLYTPQIYNQVAQLVGADKILFGSDYPLLAQSRLLKEIEALDLPQETKNLILSGNAQRLLGIEGK